MSHKYEYLIDKAIHITEKLLNEYGSRGWELVQVIQQPSGIIKTIFKREREETK